MAPSMSASVMRVTWIDMVGLIRLMSDRMESVVVRPVVGFSVVFMVADSEGPSTLASKPDCSEFWP
tara:strand:+ start:2636 stop:2833 length:198 start_codon:yes stop_codon:yes gene_type:complete